MVVAPPHYLLFSESSCGHDGGRWRFTLQPADGSDRFEASDVEPDARGERLELLTIVRALESLDQPSKVTLVGCSTHVLQGMRYGLMEWRSNGWRWEFFGQMVPVKNDDLWQRMDHALRFHRVEYGSRRFDPPHRGPGTYPVGGSAAADQQKEGLGIRIRLRRWVKYLASQASAGGLRRLTAGVRRWRRRMNRSLATDPWTDWRI